MSASSVGTANRGVPQNTSFKAVIGALPLAFALCLANLAQRQVALQRAHTEDEQHAVEMIDLVLEAAREQLLAIHLEPLAKLVLRANPHLGRTHNLLANVGKAEAPFFFVKPALAKGDFRIDEHQLLSRVLAH